MPLKYYLTLGDSIKPGETLTFHSWIEEVWNKYHENKVASAVLSGPLGIGKFYTNGVCALLDQAIFKRGGIVTSNTILGTAAADGESVPYGRP